MYTWVE